MKLILTLTILLCALGSPALAALTDADLDKIRLIVNDAEKRIKEELKAEIAGVKAELKSEIAGVETQLRTEIAQSEERVKIYVDTKFEGFDKRLTLVVGFVSALIILIVVTVGIPQVIMAWRGKNERAHERRIEELAQEIETLKQRLMVKP